MKAKTWTAVVALALSSPAGAAQATGSAGAARGADQRSGRTGEIEAITVTGCITRATAGPAASRGATDGNAASAAGSGAGVARFLLINATASSANATSTGVGADGAATYVLDGPDVAAHVGEQVQVTGSLVGGRNAPRGTTTGSAVAGNAVSAPESGPAAEGQLRVTAVRMLSKTCPSTAAAPAGRP